MDDLIKVKDKVKEVIKGLESGKTGKDIFWQWRLSLKSFGEVVCKWYIQERDEGVPVCGMTI